MQGWLGALALCGALALWILAPRRRGGVEAWRRRCNRGCARAHTVVRGMGVFPVKRAAALAARTARTARTARSRISTAIKRILKKKKQKKNGGNDITHSQSELKKAMSWSAVW